VIISRGLRWAGHVVYWGTKRYACRSLVRKRDGRKQLGRCRCRWEGSMKINPKGWDGRMETGLPWMGTCGLLL